MMTITNRNSRSSPFDMATSSSMGDIATIADKLNDTLQNGSDKLNAGLAKHVKKKKRET